MTTKSIADYDRAIQLNPNDAIAYNNRGVTKYALGRNQEAIADYDRAIQLNPNYADAYKNRGNLKSTLDDKQSAIEDYQKAADLYKQQGKTSDEQYAVNQVKKLSEQ
ncbi:tetratricopeptide repeat protein [Microcoleus sp.]|uniref:tetratricopeptide repeat protein n=1 Tax=Microcoleus sp. TaxID=44472 RepID=UPI0035948E17